MWKFIFSSPPFREGWKLFDFGDGGRLFGVYSTDSKDKSTTAYFEKSLRCISGIDLGLLGKRCNNDEQFYATLLSQFKGTGQGTGKNSNR